MEEAQTVRYQDCILGKVGAPKEWKQKALLQFMMMACSVPLTVTFNWFIHTPEVTWEQFASASYLYPLTFLLVACVRWLIANPLVDRIVKACITPRLDGMKKSLSISAINVFVMGTNVALLRMLILQGGLEGISWVGYLSTLPFSWAMSFVLSYFFINPFIKKLFVKQVVPRVETFDESWAVCHEKEAVRALSPLVVLADARARLTQRVACGSAAIRARARKLSSRVAGLVEAGFGKARAHKEAVFHDAAMRLPAAPPVLLGTGSRFALYSFATT